MHHPVMGFEHLHRHSDSSLLDGFAMVEEYASYSKEVNQKYLCITDHGVMGAVPKQISESEGHNLYPIFGCELYINPLQPKVEFREQSGEFRKTLDEAQQKRFDKSNHLLAIAYTNEGYKNLVRLSSWAWMHGFYKKPRINHDILKECKEGIIFTSTCASSEIAYAFFNDGEDAGFDKVKEYLDMFGDKFYLELMMLDYKLQKPYDAFLIKAHDKFNIPMILTQDCHYCRKENSRHQRLMLMMNGNRTVQEMQALIEAGATEDIFELQDTQLYMKSEEELNLMWETEYSTIIDYELFKQAKANTVKICELSRGVELDRKIKLPSLENEVQLLKEATMKGFVKRCLPRTKKYADRIAEELQLISDKGFASYFLIEKMMVDEAMRICPELYGFDDTSVARGPGRGSVCGSLVAYCLDLHDVEPIKHDLLFSRFLSPARGGKQMKTRWSGKPIEYAT
jgi:DNA polymerase-3 subunit alpha